MTNVLKGKLVHGTKFEDSNNYNEHKLKSKQTVGVPVRWMMLLS